MDSATGVGVDYKVMNISHGITAVEVMSPFIVPSIEEIKFFHETTHSLNKKKQGLDAISGPAVLISFCKVQRNRCRGWGRDFHCFRRLF